MSIKSDMNALKKMNSVAYPKLEPHNRFIKFIEAYAVNDEAQCKKLVDSCPKVSYVESDRAYTDRVQASIEIVSIFLLQLLEYDKVIAVANILTLVDGKQKQVGLTQKRLGEIYGFLLAFEEFCTNIMGIHPEQMVQVWNGYDDKYIKIINKIKDYFTLKQVCPDEEVKRQWLEYVFNRTWERRVKG